MRRHSKQECLVDTGYHTRVGKCHVEGFMNMKQSHNWDKKAFCVADILSFSALVWDKLIFEYGCGFEMKKKRKRKSAAVTLRVSPKLYTRTGIMGSAFAKILTPNCLTAWFLPSLIPHRFRCRFQDFECKDIFVAIKASTHHIQQVRDTGTARFLPLATLTHAHKHTSSRTLAHKCILLTPSRS